MNGKTHRHLLWEMSWKLYFLFYRTTPRNHNTQKTELLWLPRGTSVRLPFNTSARLICALKHIKTNIPSTLLDLLCWQMIDIIPEARLELNKLVRKTQGHKHRMHLNEKMAISSFAFWAITQVSYIHIYAGVHVQYHLYVCSKKVALSVLTGIQNRNEAHEQKENSLSARQHFSFPPLIHPLIRLLLFFLFLSFFHHSPSLILSALSLFLPGLITLSTFPSLLCLFTHNSLASSFLPRVCLCHSSFISPQFHPLWVLSSHLCHLSSIFKHHLQTVVSSLISSGRPDASSVSTFQQICKGRAHTRFTWYCGLFFWWI